MLFGHAAVETSFHVLNCVVYRTVTVFANNFMYLSVLGLASVNLRW